jgi:outer membrane protein TolC
MAQGQQPAASPPGEALATSEQVLALSLEDTVRLALQNNLEIERERLGPPIARTDVERARAPFDPRVGLDTNFSQTQSGRIVVGQQVTVPFANTAELTPRFTQQIITGGQYEIRFFNTYDDITRSQTSTTGRITNPLYESGVELTFEHPLLRNLGIAINTAPIQQAQIVVEAAQQQLLQTILDTVFAVHQGYWDLVFRIQDLVTQRESQKLAEDFLAENKLRVELGTLAPIELVQAETSVKERQRDVIVAEAAAREADDRLKEVLNIPETMGTWAIRLRPTDSPPFVPLTTIAVEEKVAQALHLRPDYIQSQLQIASREVDRRVAKNQLLPQLDVLGVGRVSGLGEHPGESIANIPDAQGYEWLLGLQFEYPLGNRLAQNDLERRNLELRQARVDQRRVERTIVREIRQAVRDIETAIQRVEVARATVVLARTQLEAEQEKFRLGLSTSFNVLEFQEDLTRARSQEIQALSDYNVELARLDLRTGLMQQVDNAPGKQ